MPRANGKNRNSSHDPMKHKFAFITTCMGRLLHIQRSFTRLAEDPRFGKATGQWLYVLVEFADPDNSGDWLERIHPERAHIVRIEIQEEKSVSFNKPVCQNTGAMHAIEQGAEYLVFLDADTIVTPELLSYLDQNVSLDSFLVFRSLSEKRDLTGFLCVNKRHFVRVGGYDVNFQGWGAEDLEMRVRLFLKAGLSFGEISADLASSIPHEDQLRTKHYQEKNKDRSHDRNLSLLCGNIMQWTGKHILEHYEGPQGTHIRRLLGIEPFSVRELMLPPR